MRGAVRVAALSGVHVIYSWTHDSIGLGQDGPTHQPDRAAGRRAGHARPAGDPAGRRQRDGPGLAHRRRQRRARPPSILSRQAIPVLAETADLAAEGVPRGGYVLRDPDGGPPQLVLIGTGSEVHLCLAAADLLAATGVAGPGGVLPLVGPVRPSSPTSYRREVLPAGVPRLAVEAASSFGWERYADATVSHRPLRGLGAG